MSSATARCPGWRIYFYAGERHRRPHASVRGPGFAFVVRLDDGAVLASRGDVPDRVVRGVRDTIAGHREVFYRAFYDTLEQRFPGTLDDVIGQRRADRHARTGDELVLVDVTEVRVLARYVLELTFDTGETRVIDLESRLTGPMFEPVVADYAMFQAVEVDHDAGTIVWPNGADLSPSRLYSDSKPALPAERPETHALPSQVA